MTDEEHDALVDSLISTHPDGFGGEDVVLSTRWLTRVERRELRLQIHAYNIPVDPTDERALRRRERAIIKDVLLCRGCRLLTGKQKTAIRAYDEQDDIRDVQRALHIRRTAANRVLHRAWRLLGLACESWPYWDWWETMREWPES